MTLTLCRVPALLSRVRFAHLSALCVLAAPLSHAAVHYVNLTSAIPSPPYTDWSTAATNIQDAVDASAAGDEIIVTNGVYALGGRMVTNLVYDPFGQILTNVTLNRVMVSTAVSLRSVNGPEFTEINGGGTNRCAYLTNGASLSGFCLRRGFADSGGGVYCISTNAALTNCLIIENTGGQGGLWVGDLSGGGGACDGVFYSCIFSNNTGTYGGAVFAPHGHKAALYNCIVSGNTAAAMGGGAYRSVLYNCTVSNNAAIHGGGVSGDPNSRYALYNCRLIGNSASGRGGAADENCDLYNCLLTGNHANYGGGAADYCGLYNCTVTSNTAATAGGGTYTASAYNSIIFFNTAPVRANYDTVVQPQFYYCCTTPLPPPPGYGNITNEPLFLDRAGGNFRLQAASPCINAGSLAYATGLDLDGNLRMVGGAADIGAYEYQGASGGLVISSVSASGADITLTWRSVAGSNYLVECSTNLVAPSYFFPIASNVRGGGGTTGWTHTNALGMHARFYRVGIQ